MVKAETVLSRMGSNRFHHNWDDVIGAMKKYAKAASREQRKKCAAFIDIRGKKTTKGGKKLIGAFMELVEMTPEIKLK